MALAVGTYRLTRAKAVTWYTTLASRGRSARSSPATAKHGKAASRYRPMPKKFLVLSAGSRMMSRV